MKLKVRKLLVFLFSLLVLASSNGIVLAIHTCLASASRDVSLFNEGSCCPVEDIHCNANCDEDPSVESKCCSSEFAYFKISSPFQVEKPTVVAPADVVIASSFQFTLAESTNNFPGNRFLIPATLGKPLLFHQLLI